MRVCTFFLALFLIFGLSAGHAEVEYVVNGDFATGDLTGWTAFANGSGTIPPMAYRSGAPGLSSPADGHAVGTDIGTNTPTAPGRYTGVYQVITGLTPGVPCPVSAEGEIWNIQNGAPYSPNDGDDFVGLFWVDGSDTGFATTWPGSAVIVDSTVSNVGNWVPLSGVIVPSGDTVILGGVVNYQDPQSDYSFHSSLMDNFSLDGPAPASVNRWNAYR